MKITKITEQLKSRSRFSVFVDAKYAFSLSGTALLDSGIASGQIVSEAELAKLRKLSLDDKAYAKTLRYAEMRLRTNWEVCQYMARLNVPSSLAEKILNKLTNIGLLDDYKYAVSFAKDRHLLRSSSRRKIIYELKKRHISESAIQQALTDAEENDASALQELIARKRRQLKYKDDFKLTQYLGRQGFNYSDIKDALTAAKEL